jgi:hypothetical protein
MKVLYKLAVAQVVNKFPVEDSGPLECEVLSMGECFLMFRRKIVPLVVK